MLFKVFHNLTFLPTQIVYAWINFSEHPRAQITIKCGLALCLIPWSKLLFHFTDVKKWHSKRSSDLPLITERTEVEKKMVKLRSSNNTVLYRGAASSLANHPYFALLSNMLHSCNPNACLTAFLVSHKHLKIPNNELSFYSTSTCPSFSPSYKRKKKPPSISCPSQIPGTMIYPLLSLLLFPNVSVNSWSFSSKVYISYLSVSFHIFPSSRQSDLLTWSIP